MNLYGNVNRAKLFLRDVSWRKCRNLSPARDDCRAPLQVLRVVAGDGLEVNGLELFGDGADIAVTDLAVVQLAHRSQVRGGACQEDLIGQIQL